MFSLQIIIYNDRKGKTGRRNDFRAKEGKNF